MQGMLLDRSAYLLFLVLGVSTRRRCGLCVTAPKLRPPQGDVVVLTVAINKLLVSTNLTNCVGNVDRTDGVQQRFQI